MTEEQITKLILKWLEFNDWRILCFDFPQSGTGYSLHLNESSRQNKNKGSFIPDIVAVKNEIVVFFENKDRFFLKDFLKIQNLIIENNYSNAIAKLLNDISFNKIYYGVGLPETEPIKKKIKANIDKVDFAIFVNEDQSIVVYYQNSKIF